MLKYKDKLEEDPIDDGFPNEKLWIVEDIATH